MSNNQEGFEEQGDFGLDLFTEQDLVDRLVQSVTDDDLYQVVFWIKRLQEKGWSENINDGRAFKLLLFPSSPQVVEPI